MGLGMPRMWLTESRGAHQVKAERIAGSRVQKGPKGPANSCHFSGALCLPSLNSPGQTRAQGSVTHSATSFDLGPLQGNGDAV